jgi:flagellar biosynthetic protein FlhB
MSEEKTQEATPQKLRQAREQGQVVRSQEWTAAATLTASVVTAKVFLPVIWDNLQTLVRTSLLRCADSSSLPSHLSSLGSTLLILAATSTLAGLSAQWLTSGWVFSTSNLQPQLQRISPLNNAKKWVSPKMLADALKLLIKALLTLGITWLYLLQPLLEKNLFSELGQASLSGKGSLLWGWLQRLCLAHLFLGGADWLYQRWEYFRGLRMSRYEVKQEHRQSEGDPHQKGRQRQLAHKLVKSRSLKGLENATVVINNPTHISVAIRFDFDLPAPKVVAKGKDQMALLIRKIAASKGIAMINDKPLARALYPVEVDDFIPTDLYQPVAEILVAVARAEGKYAR